MAGQRITVELRPPSAPSACDVARRYAEMGQVDAAVGELQKVLRSNPDDAEAHGLLGSIHLAEDRYADAARELEAATRLEPGSAWWRFKLGVVRIWQGDLDQARRDIEAAIEVEPDMAAAHAELGQVYHDLGRADDAVAAWQRAVSLGSEVAEANFNLGAVYYNAGRTEEAIPLLETAVRTGTPQVAGAAHVALAFARRDQGDGKGSLVEFVRAADLGNGQAIEVLRSVGITEAQMQALRNEAGGA